MGEAPPASQREPFVEVRGAEKRFGQRRALAGVDLVIARGEAVGLVGPNGAGKTTLLRTLALLSRPRIGTVRIAGLDSRRDPGSIRRLVGYLSHQTLLYPDLSAAQNLTYCARLYDVPNARARVMELLGRLGLAERRDDLVRTLSRGMQQRLAIARTLLHRPRLLLLDEPHTGLDPRAVSLLDALLGEAHSDGCTLLMSGHDIPRAAGLCDRLVLMERGRVADDRPRAAWAEDWLAGLAGASALSGPGSRPGLAGGRG